MTAQSATGAVINGKIESIAVNDPRDPFSGGTMVVAGQLVIIPRNLLIDLPANRLTLQQLFADAPERNQEAGETGLAALDRTGNGGGFANILANRNQFGNVIAGHVFVEKGQEIVTGTVTHIDHTQGYLRIDGIPGDPTTGLMIRINDPEARHTIQSGLGTDGGPNGSADPRFGLDPDNYTIAFSNGYPAGIPSTVPVGQRSGFAPGDNPAAASNANGVGDPFCPANNRGGAVAADSRRFAPIRLGDSINAEGNMEDIGGVRFVSAHTLTVFASIGTLNSPTQPDYVTFDEAEWDVPGFQNGRVRGLFIGFTTLPDSQLDLYALYVDPNTGLNHEFIMASTVNNPDTVNQGLGASAGGIFKIRYDLDFQEGATGDIDPRRSPGQNLVNAGFGSSFPTGAGNFEANFAKMSPISREIIARTRHKLLLAPGVITRDINGNEAPNGEYLTPVGLGFPEFVEIDLGALQTPFIFEGIPWNLDRRLAPGGADGSTSPKPLDPFPVSGLNPIAQTANAPSNIAARVFGFYPFTASSVLNSAVVMPAPIPIPVTPGLPATSTPPASLLGATMTRETSGSCQVHVLAAADPGQVLEARVGGAALILQEVAPGKYFDRILLAPYTAAGSVTLRSLSDPTIPTSTRPVVDVVAVTRALYTASKGGGTLEVRATSSDGLGPVLQAFGDDGALLGTLSRGVLTLSTSTPPAAVKVVSATGGSDTLATTFARAR